MKKLAWAVFFFAMLTGAAHSGPSRNREFTMAVPNDDILAVLNLSRPQYEVTDFGADPTGMTPADTPIRNAIAACDGTLGCDIHFPAGTYKLSSTTSCSGRSAVEFCLPAAPITFSGDGPGASIIDAPTNSDIFVGPNPGPMNGIVIHDLTLAFPTPSTTGNAINLPFVDVAALYNLNFSGASNAISLGYNDAVASPPPHTSNIYMDALTLQNNSGCVLNLQGSDYGTYVSHVYAQAASSPFSNAQVLCIPHQVGVRGASLGSAFGVNKFYLSDSNFEGFGRGIPIELYEFSFWDAYFSNVYVDTTAGGPSLEIIAIPNGDGGSTNVSNIRVSNSSFSSSSTSCITYGQVTNVHMVGVNCDGSIPVAIPTIAGCSTATASAGTEAYILYGGSITTGSPSISLTLTVPPAAPTTMIATPTSSDSTVGDVVKHLATEINTYNQTIGNCGALVYADNVGSLLPIRSYNSGSQAPSFSTSVTAGITLVQPTSTASYTFASSDGLRIDGHATVPKQVSITTSDFAGAPSASGVHVFGGQSITLSNDRMNSAGGAASMYGVWFDQNGSYSNIVLNDDDLSGNSAPAM